MKHLTFITLALGACGLASGEMLYHEPFDYPAGDLTGDGGSGWADAWTDSGNPAVVSAFGLSYSDPSGRILDVSGNSANTANGGTATTISLRDFHTGPLNDVWISLLYQLPASNNKFEGVTFYRGTQKLFSVGNPSSTSTASIQLIKELGLATGTGTGKGVFGQTHFVALKLTKGGGEGGVDRVEAFVDPVLGDIPLSPDATIDGADYDFDRVRLAGQDGSPLLVDEIRVGDNWEDVSPHTTPPDTDSDLDGLTDAQEIELGLDPNESNAAFFAALRANPGWLSLHSPAEITDMSIGGLTMLQNSPGDMSYTFSLRDRFGNPTEDIDRSLTTPPNTRFLRLKIDTP
jgi:hypothetical protein